MKNRDGVNPKRTRRATRVCSGHRPPQKVDPGRLKEPTRCVWFSFPKEQKKMTLAAVPNPDFVLSLTILPALVSLEWESHKDSSPPMFRRLPAGSQEGRSSHLAALV